MEYPFDPDKARRIAHESAAEMGPALAPEAYAAMTREFAADHADLINQVGSIMGIEPDKLAGPVKFLSREEVVEKLLSEQLEERKKHFESLSEPQRRAAQESRSFERLTREVGEYIGKSAVYELAQCLDDPERTILLYPDNLARLIPNDRKAVHAHELAHRGDIQDIAWFLDYVEQEAQQVEDGLARSTSKREFHRVLQRELDFISLVEGGCDAVGEKVSPGYKARVAKRVRGGPRFRDRKAYRERLRTRKFYAAVESMTGSFAASRKKVWESPENLPTRQERKRPRAWAKRVGLPTNQSKRRWG